LREKVFFKHDSECTTTYIPSKMRAVEISKSGPPDVLQLVERDLLPVGTHDVVIRVAAAGMNRADLLQRRGMYPPPAGATDIPGLEVSGIVEAVGPDVIGWKPGDKVCALLPGGGYAEYAVAHQDLCLRVPQGLNMLEAACIPEACFTVWNNVFLRGGLKAGETLLVHGGTSGIGHMAIQMGAQTGAAVYATTSDNSKKHECMRFGAKLAISRKNEDYIEVLRKHVPGGINVVLDIAGGETLGRDFECMALDGRHVSIAHMEGKTASFDVPTLMKKRLLVTGSTLRGRPIPELAVIAHDLEKNIWPLIDAGIIRPHIDRSFPITDVVGAHKYMESSSHIGKIVLSL